MATTDTGPFPALPTTTSATRGRAPIPAEPAVEPTHGPVAAPDATVRPPRPASGDRWDPLSTLARSWRLLAVFLLLGAIVLAAAVSLRPTTYASTAKVLWQSDVSRFLPAGTVAAGNDDADRALSTQADVITGDTVMQAAARATGTQLKDLRERTAVQVEQASNVLTVTVSASTAAKAEAQAQAVVTSYMSASKQQGVAALNGQADALQKPIDALQTRLDQLNAVVLPVAVTPAQTAAAAAQTAATDASRTAVVGQLSSLTTQQDQLRAAAAVYPGQASVLSDADRPDHRSGLSLPVSVVLGAALGLVLGVLVVLVRAARRRDGTAGAAR